MSTHLPLISPCSPRTFSQPAVLSPLADRRKHKRKNEVRRRPDRVQGTALELLAHALEYLVDNETAQPEFNQAHIQEAVHLLAEKSRAVFAECPEIVPLSHRLLRLLPRLFTLPGIHEEDPVRHRLSGPAHHAD